MVKKIDWDNVSLRQFNEIQELIKEQDEYTQFNILDLLYGIDSTNMTINEVAEYNDCLGFLKNDIKPVDLKKEYEINGTVYDSHCDLTMVTIAQFIDYQEYIKKGDVRYNDILSVFFIPKGHKYNDGYDMNRVKNDLLDLDMVSVKSAAFFFEKQLRLFVNLFLSYFKESVKKMKIDKRKKQQIMRLLYAINLG